MEIKNYVIKVKIKGIKDSKHLMQDIEEELLKRSHLTNPKLQLSDDGEIMVEVEAEFLNTEMAGKAIQEEVWEVVTAFTEEAGFSVHVVDAIEIS